MRDAQVDDPTDARLPRRLEQREGVPDRLLVTEEGVVEADPVGVHERARAPERLREPVGTIEVEGAHLHALPERVRAPRRVRDGADAGARGQESSRDMASGVAERAGHDNRSSIPAHVGRLLAGREESSYTCPDNTN